VKVVCKDNQDGDAADGIELRNFLSHGRCRPLNAGRKSDAKLQALRFYRARSKKVKSGGKRRGCGGRAPNQSADTKTSKLIAEFHSLADGRKRPIPAGAEAHPQERRL